MKLAKGLAAAALVSLEATVIALAQSQDDGAAFAGQLWEQLVNQRLVGPDSIAAVPYLREGQAHGPTLVSLISTATVGDVTGEVIVKRSYGGEDATRENIIADPAGSLQNITVMFKRAGYDPENEDWFWAMYTPDGSVGEMEGAAVAGKVAMCTGCHAQAPGGDYLFLK